MPFGNSDRELELITEPGEAITVLLAEEAHFHRIFASLSGQDPSRVLSGGQFLVTAPDSVAKLRDYWDGILVASANRNACPMALPDIVAGMLDAIELPGRAHHSSGAKSGVFSRVMHAAKQANFAASVPELSAQLGMSRRSIEYAFVENVGTSPHAYFILRRLNLCKHALQEADPVRRTVAEIATQHGFRELGRFAAIYRRQFGELPSETLRGNRFRSTIRVSPIRSQSRASQGLAALATS